MKMKMKMMMKMIVIWTVMLCGRVQAQSGEPDTDMVYSESSVSCSAHISLKPEDNNISCELQHRGYDLEDDDEDDEEDAIEKMTACCCALVGEERCVEAMGDTLNSKDLNPVSPITLTVWSKRGHRINKQLDLQQIIKPKSPEVDVTLNKDQALVLVQVPYEEDYLREENLLLQLQLWGDNTNQTQNMTSSTVLIGWEFLRPGTQYQVKARALPWIDFQGTWSEWSRTSTFQTPAITMDKHTGEASENMPEILWSVVVPVVLLLFVCAGLMWKNKIQKYMWPSIPKTTLEKICGPNKGPLQFCIPEEFTFLNVSTAAESPTAAPPCRDTPDSSPSCSNETKDSSSTKKEDSSPSSTQSTNASLSPSSSSSAGTEEVELLSHCSSEEEEEVQVETSPTPQQEKDHSYVTMSSFHQIKPAATAHTTN